MTDKEIISNLVKAYNLADVTITGNGAVRTQANRYIDNVKVSIKQALLMYGKELHYIPGKGFKAKNIESSCTQ
jgi:hypothetical protein